MSPQLCPCYISPEGAAAHSPPTPPPVQSRHLRLALGRFPAADVGPRGSQRRSGALWATHRLATGVPGIASLGGQNLETRESGAAADDPVLPLAFDQFNERSSENADKLIPAHTATEPEQRTFAAAVVLVAANNKESREMIGIDGLIYGLTVIVVLAVFLTLRRGRH